MLRLLQRGDTIIEVLLAVTVFSLVSVGSMTIMNQSANAAQQAIEITLVRQQIDSQVEALRAAHQAYSRLPTDARTTSVWKTLVNTNVQSITGDGCPTQEALKASNTFIMNPQSASLMTVDSGDVLSILSEDAPVFPQFTRSEGDAGSAVGYGLWIEPSLQQALDTSIPDAYNFRVRACWYGAGTGSTPMQIETTVRLYDVE